MTTRNPVRFLLETEMPWPRYVLVAFLMSTPLAFAISLALGWLGLLGEMPMDSSRTGPGWVVYQVLLVVVLGPFIETLLMIPILAPMRRIGSPVIICLLSGAVWALFHSLLVLLWGVAIFFTFVVLTASFLRWEKQSRKKAILVVTAIHGLNNLVALLLSLVWPD
jgi:hypothetical protein